jgi:Fe-S cluster assembly scaffold protein SufB
MYIDSNDVIANHNTTIGNINKDYLFYLNSKGIEDKQATNLIINGFIKSILNEYMNDIIESQK